MNEITVNLNVHEMGILLSALTNLEIVEEMHISREYGSATALYNRLYPLWEQMDSSETGLRNDMVPSF
jgi:hypothetical protein